MVGRKTKQKQPSTVEGVTTGATNAREMTANKDRVLELAHRFRTAAQGFDSLEIVCAFYVLIADRHKG